MTKYGPKIGSERRKRPDIWVKSLRWFAVGGWILIFAALLFLGLAKPPAETLFDRQFYVAGRSSWDLKLARYILFVMIFGLWVSGVALTINIKRNRRKEDELRVSLILLGLISFLGILVYHILF